MFDSSDLPFPAPLITPVYRDIHYVTSSVNGALVSFNGRMA